MSQITYSWSKVVPVEQATYCGAGYLLWSRLPSVEQSTYSSAGYLVSTEDQATLPGSKVLFVEQDTYILGYLITVEQATLP